MVIEIDHPRAAALATALTTPAQFPHTTGLGNYDAAFWVAGDVIDQFSALPICPNPFSLSEKDGGFDDSEELGLYLPLSYVIDALSCKEIVRQ